MHRYWLSTRGRMEKKMKEVVAEDYIYIQKKEVVTEDFIYDHLAGTTIGLGSGVVAEDR